MKACVIIPTYNEAENIGSLLKEIRLREIDVAVIDDGSSDRTQDIARQEGAVVIRNERNSGKGKSLACGFSYALGAGYEAVITMDGDGQHLAEDIPFFLRLAAYSQNAVFVGNRMHKAKTMPLLRYLTNRFMSWLISLVAKQKIPDTQCGFRLFKRPALEGLKLYTNRYETESEILLRCARRGFKIQSIPIRTVYNGARSRINPVTDTLRFIRFLLRELWTSRS
jgi:glycosyltransferase involved in cell wall biosynthesis